MGIFSAVGEWQPVRKRGQQLWESQWMWPERKSRTTAGEKLREKKNLRRPSASESKILNYFRVVSDIPVHLKLRVEFKKYFRHPEEEEEEEDHYSSAM